MARVTGVGGIFFKTKGDPKELTAWYKKHLGMPVEEFGGAVLKWPEDKAEDGGMTVWHLAGKHSKWFDAPLMITYRVDDLGELLAQSRAGGVVVVGGPESLENCMFAWIRDPDGNKVELWEPKTWDDRNKGA